MYECMYVCMYACMQNTLFICCLLLSNWSLPPSSPYSILWGLRARGEHELPKPDAISDGRLPLVELKLGDGGSETMLWFLWMLEANPVKVTSTGRLNIVI